MKKEAVKRAMLAFPIGICISYVITILISLWNPDGSYSPCVPELIEEMGGEIRAVIVQAVLSGVLGASFGAASVIWEMDNLSIIKQTGLYFVVVSLTMLPVAYLTHWMEHTLSGFLIYFGIFFAIFVVIFLVQYVFWKKKVSNLNTKLPQ